MVIKKLESCIFDGLIQFYNCIGYSNSSSLKYEKLHLIFLISTCSVSKYPFVTDCDVEKLKRVSASIAYMGS